ncbi:hypothetical protein [Streptomyces abyssomicinicus]|uniref:hypothetical protein n=1 Tax=Streptomyces abyssomicinicus TaxID=574929 RepID=UPI0012502F65|nr:hypothetical protein [Streptomyces abyssomicinicus]
MSTEARRPVPPVRPPHDPSASSMPAAAHRRDAGDRADGAPPPPAASARFPDAPPAVGSGPTAQETTVRLRRVPPGPPTRAGATARPPWGPPGARTAAIPPVPLQAPGEAPGRVRGRLGAALACGLLGTGLLAAGVTAGVTGGADGQEDTYAEARDLWRTTPVDELFPPSVKGDGLGPGGADRTWNRIAVAPESGCSDAFDPGLRKTLSPVGCERLLRATYTDATGSHVVTVGLLFTEADAEEMRALRSRISEDGLDRRADQLPRPYAAEGTAAEAFGEEQRASWAVDVLTEAPVVVYAVSGWVDARTVEEPVPAREALEGDTKTAAAQAGLGHDAGRLAGLFAQDLRKTVAPARETPS